jgi:hypothetical protein
LRTMMGGGAGRGQAVGEGLGEALQGVTLGLKEGLQLLVVNLLNQFIDRFNSLCISSDSLLLFPIDYCNHVRVVIVVYGHRSPSTVPPIGLGAPSAAYTRSLTR